MLTMKHIWIPALVITVAMSACGRRQGQEVTSTSSAHIATPTNPNDTAAWETYMVQVGKVNNHGMANRPYLFIVPSGDVPSAHDRRQQIQQALTDMASRNGFPGNVIAVGGPDPAMTADVLVAAFGAAKPGSLKTLSLIYTGDDADKLRVEKSIATAGATFRYVKM
jgi:hypothetical protein